MDWSDELRHLQVGPEAGESPGGVGTMAVTAVCGGDAAEVLDRCRAVLIPVVEHQAEEWPLVEQWRQLLPAWFVTACAEEKSEEERAGWLAWWRSLPAEEKASAAREKPWELADWLYWLEPDERQWFWWDAELDGPNRLRVHIEAEGWPVPFGALEWLLRAAGAIEIILPD